MRLLPPLSAILLASLLAGCPNGGPSDGGTPTDGHCTLEVELGRGTPDAFEPIAEGEPMEVILGFQGFRMLEMTVRVAGGDPEEAEISGYVTVEDSGVEVSQPPRRVRLRTGSDGAGYGESFQVFFNDVPASEIVGYRATLELIARSAGCVGGLSRSIELRDDEACVSWDASVPDAGILDGGIPDGAVACGEEP